MEASVSVESRADSVSLLKGIEQHEDGILTRNTGRGDQRRANNDALNKRLWTISVTKK